MNDLLRETEGVANLIISADNIMMRKIIMSSDPKSGECIAELMELHCQCLTTIASHTILTGLKAAADNKEVLASVQGLKDDLLDAIDSHIDLKVNKACEHFGIKNYTLPDKNAKNTANKIIQGLNK